MISQFFIDRPVLANVLAILFVLIGAVALVRLPITEYPDLAVRKAWSIQWPCRSSAQ